MKYCVTEIYADNGEESGQLVVCPSGETLYAEDCAKHLNNLQKELDELKAHNDQLQSLLSTQELALNKIKADAVREAAEKLKYSHYVATGVSTKACGFKQLLEYANQLEGKE